MANTDHLKPYQFKPGDPRIHPLPSNVGEASAHAAREFAKKIVDDPEYRRTVHARALAGKLPPAVEVLLWHYRWGKPKDSVDVNLRANSAAIAALSDEEALQRHHALTQRLLEAKHAAAAVAAAADAEPARDALGVAWPPLASKATN